MGVAAACSALFLIGSRAWLVMLVSTLVLVMPDANGTGGNAEMPPGQFRFNLPDGFIEGKVTVDPARDSTAITEWTVPETAEGIFLQLASERTSQTQFYVDFIAVEVFGYAPNSRLGGDLRSCGIVSRR